MNKKKIYGPLARFLRAGVRPFLHRWDTSGAQKAQPPAVYVVHHRNMSGPVHTLALLPDEPRPWVLHVFLDRHECFAQYYGYTFRKRFGWPAPAAWAAAGVLSLTVPAVVRSFGAIPVYRSLKETRDMMEQSAQALLRGESIMLCPDVAYDSAAPATGEIYKGFLQLEKLYHAGTGAHLRFVPVYCGKTKRIVTGEPVCFSDGAPFRTQREEVAGRIVDGLNALAAACGELEREAAEKILSFLDEKELKNKSGLLVAHGETVRAAAYEKLGLKGETACFQVIYTSKSLRSLKGELNFRIPDRAEIERIKSEYHLESPENIEMLCSERKIWCGFLKSGEFVGFIGRHPEGSMGLLQVFSEYRRQGYGEELESFMINRFLEEGRVPYAHIIVDNEKSMNLQKKLGYEVADKKIYWLFEK